VETTSSARSRRFSVILKKNRRAVALTLTSYRRPDRRQPQLIAMDILGGGLSADRPRKSANLLTWRI